jgi:hypothetical protein
MVILGKVQRKATHVDRLLDQPLLISAACVARKGHKLQYLKTKMDRHECRPIVLTIA